ncbi:hypothetical protein L596_019304 [Steinernema carpocapsae]|uniref:Elongation of very long chain fatty acids protein n=1 Tax=Steinernema carpocapsae TaxID=34508 RepID=A0A4U5MQ21_STECR|nr:hypothetical protein L596_019304 [Steinernema carpocapsae]
MSRSIVARLARTPLEPYDHQKARKLMLDFQPYAAAASAIYVVAVFGIQRLMRHREPFQLKWPLVLWNATLAVFSGFGFFYSFSDIFEMALEHNSVSATYCLLGSALTGKNGIWGFLFTVSKLYEFGDTFFIVLRKKKLIFLHWYHHIATLNYVVYAYAGNNTFTTWFLCLNFGIHTLMYTYFMVTALGVKLPGFVSRSITTLQLVQFSTTLFVMAHIGVLKFLYDVPCHFDNLAWLLAVVMTLSYFILFVNFFYKAYVKNGKSAREEKKTK